MDITSFNMLVSWVISHDYFFIFVGTFLIGPLVTAAAGVAAALGYYNIIFIIVLSVIADLAGDLICYVVGYATRRTFVDTYGPKIGLSIDRIDRIEHFVDRHFTKAMIIIKLSAFIPIPGLIIMGSSRVSLKKFTIMCLVLAVLKSVIFGLLGFYSGKTYGYLATMIANSQYIFLAMTIIIILAYLGYQKFSHYLSRKIANDKHILP